MIHKRLSLLLLRKFLFLIFSFYFINTYAQLSFDSSQVHLQKSIAYATRLYKSSVKNQRLVFNGPEYNEYPEPYEGFPYFKSEYWEEGSVRYKGQQYDSITMMYDLYKDELVIEHYDQKGFAIKINLDKKNVDGFTLLGSTFTKLSNDSAHKAGVRAGYYEVLYDGDIQLIARHKKDIIKETTPNSYVLTFIPKNDYYLVKENQYHSVKGKSSIKRVFSDKKKMINQFIRQRYLSFSPEAREHTLALISSYYDSLTH